MVLAVIRHPAPAVAQDTIYTLATSALYRVDPDAGQISVSVDVTFTNQTPDPPGRIAVFPVALLAIHDGASEIVARDGEGDLEVTTAVEQEANVATITLREPIRFEQTTAFSLEYALVDQAAQGVRVRPSATVFPAWGFGTRSEVTVELPAEYRVDVQGDALEAQSAEQLTTLTSGPIDEPAQWVAIVTADRPSEVVAVQRSVPLASGTADLRVEAWSDDEAWGTRTLDLLARALPVLEAEIGLPYLHAGPLTVTESVSRSETGFDGQASAGILLGFDQPPFTALHEAAHIWIGPNLFESRWIYEGFASHYAEVAAQQLGVERPYDPRVVAAERAASAFPLDDWLPSDDPSPDRDAFGYPASWVVIADVAARAGPERLRDVLARIADGTSAYAVAGDDPGAPSGGRVGSRELLDHLESEGVAYGDLFLGRVFKAETSDLLGARGEARAAYADLLLEAGEWGAPGPVAEALAAWDFPAAVEAIAVAHDWLAERDALTADLAGAGIRPPASLETAYRDRAGLPDGDAELDAQRELLEAYVHAASLAAADRAPLEELGLLGAAAPEEELASAAELFSTGELEAARELIGEVSERLAEAEGTGLMRVAAVAILVVGVAVLLAARLSRRRSRDRPG